MVFEWLKSVINCNKYTTLVGDADIDNKEAYEYALIICMQEYMGNLCTFFSKICVCVCVCESRTSLKTILKKKIFHSKYFDSISNYVLSRSKICTDIVENPEWSFWPTQYFSAWYHSDYYSHISKFLCKY